MRKNCSALAAGMGLNIDEAQQLIKCAGILLNVMLTGKPQTEAYVKGRTGRIVRKCTALNPEDQYHSAEKLRDAL